MADRERGFDVMEETPAGMSVRRAGVDLCKGSLSGKMTFKLFEQMNSMILLRITLDLSRTDFR